MAHLRNCFGLLLSYLIVSMASLAASAAELTALPPIAAWGTASEVDEPESAFHSLGRTMWHQGRSATRIAAFHQWLKAKGIEPLGLLPQSLRTPSDARRMLIEPERSPNCGWRAIKDAIVKCQDIADPRHGCR